MHEVLVNVIVSNLFFATNHLSIQSSSSNKDEAIVGLWECRGRIKKMKGWLRWWNNRALRWDWKWKITKPCLLTTDVPNIQRETEANVRTTFERERKKKKQNQWRWLSKVDAAKEMNECKNAKTNEWWMKFSHLPLINDGFDIKTESRTHCVHILTIQLFRYCWFPGVVQPSFFFFLFHNKENNGAD